MKVAGYIRVSSPAQAAEGESLNTQKSQIEQFVKMKDWTLTKIYEDAELSGGKAETRPAFQEMIRDAEKRNFEGIVFTKLSRFARSASDFLRYRDRLKKYDVFLFSIKEGLDPQNKVGQLLMGFIAMIAEWDKENIREQMVENKLVRWQKGETKIGAAPFGYSWIKENGKVMLQPNPDEAAIFNDIVNMYLNGNLCFSDIALTLNEKGARSRRKPWTTSVLSYMLKNPVYHGTYFVNKHKYGDSARGEAGTRRTGELKPQGEWIAIEIQNPLISKGDWDRIQAKTAFNVNKGKRVSKDNTAFWLRDLLKCGICGASIKPHKARIRIDGTSQRYYSCYYSHVPEKGLKLQKRSKCPLPRIPGNWLENQIWLELMNLYVIGHKPGDPAISAPKGVMDEDRYKKPLADARKVLKLHEADLKRLQRMRDRLWESHGDKNFRKDEVAGKLTKNLEEISVVKTKIKDAEEELAKIEKAKKNDEQYKRFLTDEKAALETLGQEIARLSPEDKKRLAEGSIVGFKIRICQDLPGSSRF